MGDVHLYLAPAAAGKTAYVLGRVRAAAAHLAAMPRVLVPTRLQVRSWRHRLAESGGVIGVSVQTFDDLYRECLNQAGAVYTELGEAAQVQLLQAVVGSLELRYYAPIADRPGLIRLLRGLIGELKAGMILPETLAEGMAAAGSPSRLVEVAQIYAAYQCWLQTSKWADSAGLGWLAVAALREEVPELGHRWPLLVVDGFDSLTSAQLALLEVMAERVGTMIVTLTGQVDGSEQRLVHRRFDDTRDRLESALGVTAESVPESACSHVTALLHLERGFLSDQADAVDGSGVVDMVAAPDRVGEVRVALRWLKARLLEDGLQPEQVALLARDLGPYRESIRQIASEFGLPVRLTDGWLLQSNPAVAALLGLLRMMLPQSAENPEFALPRRGVVEAWRSPYFEWPATAANETAEPIRIETADADLLDAVARWGRVVGGHSQWEEVLRGLVSRKDEGEPEEDDRGLPAGVPIGQAALDLQAKFRWFVRCLQPPAGRQPLRSLVVWLEDLIGPDSEDVPQENLGAPDENTGAGLHMVRRICAGTVESAERDLAALAALKDILRGLVWAEESLGSRPTDYAGFFHQLARAVEGTTFQLSMRSDREEFLAADVVQARGVPFRAVAILGLAESEFPARLSEDPLLPDADRKRLRQDPRLPLPLSVESAEAEFFYEAMARARDRLLLTRPRLDDNGALWRPSPFWEEVARLSGVAPVTLLSESVPTPNEAASWPELVESLVVERGNAAAWSWLAEVQPTRQAALEHAAEILRRRSRERTGGAYDGDLSALAADLAIEFGPGSHWSASRLESYRACPFQFWVTNLLELAPREEPAEGLDARQLGNIYHRILERLYRAPEVEDRTDLDQLVAALERVAPEVLDKAPRQEGFRETAWWQQTRIEIEQNVRRSLEALSALPGDFVPLRYEVAFGFRGAPALAVHDGDDHFWMRGLIDRIDRSPDGRLRVIDYKISHPTGFDNRAIAEGTKLQLPLYAVAAQDALQLGKTVEGFYWHVRHAEPSRFTLSDFPGGPEGAFEIAIEKAWEAIAGVRRGLFMPDPPEGGCPPYCPAVGFCWHLNPGRRGGA